MWYCQVKLEPRFPWFTFINSSQCLIETKRALICNCSMTTAWARHLIHVIFSWKIWVIICLKIPNFLCLYWRWHVTNCSMLLVGWCPPTKYQQSPLRIRADSSPKQEKVKWLYDEQCFLSDSLHWSLLNVSNRVKHSNIHWFIYYL